MRYCAAVIILAWAACLVTEGAEVELQQVQLPGSPEFQDAGGGLVVHQFREAHGNSDLGEGNAEEPENEAASEKKPKFTKEYFKIPNMKFEHKTTSVPETPLPKCKVLCDDSESLISHTM